MSKIIAYCGFDESREEILDIAIHAVKESGKETPNVLLVPTASFDTYSPDLLNTYYKLGCRIDKLLLWNSGLNDLIIAEKIHSADIIHVPGGNTKFLMETWIKTGAFKYFREAYDMNKVLVGSSAGALCWFSKCFDDCGMYDRKMIIDGCNFKPFAICPHYDNEEWQSFDMAVSNGNIPGLAIEDGAALCLIDGQNYILKAKGGETCYYFDSDNYFEKIDLSYNGDILSRL